MEKQRIKALRQAQLYGYLISRRWCETEKRMVSKRACLPIAPVLLVCPDGDFGTSRFKGSDILRHLTHPGNRWRRTKTLRPRETRFADPRLVYLLTVLKPVA
jgi:hypothetical protein